ncbi:helix-turn-helix domain-containing protein [Nocardia sp. R16R-3T]
MWLGKSAYRGCTQLGYNRRRYPTPDQVAALARAFGCARVVFNDALHHGGTPAPPVYPYPTDAALSKTLTESNKTLNGARVAEVSSVVRHQRPARGRGYSVK